MEMELVSKKHQAISKNILERNDFRFDEKVYRYLDIDPKNHTDMDEIVLDFIASKNLPRTRIEYASDIRNFKTFFSMERNEELLGIRHQQGKKYLLWLEQESLSSSVIKRRITVMRGLFDWIRGYFEEYGNEEHKIIANPFKLIKGPKVQQDMLATASLSEKEINAFIASVAPDKDTDIARDIVERNRCMLLLHLSTGVRASELVQAKPSSFLPYGTDNVVYRYVSKGWEIKESVIEHRLYERLRGYSERCGIEKDSFLFRSLSQNPQNRKDQAMNISSYWDMVQKYAEKSELKKHIGTHSLRASFITLLHEKGLWVQEIKDAVGHKSIQMTSHYIKSHYDSKKKWSRVMNSLLEF